MRRLVSRHGANVKMCGWNQFHNLFMGCVRVCVCACVSVCVCVCVCV